LSRRGFGNIGRLGDGIDEFGFIHVVPLSLLLKYF
jgi:hypothetical protein